MAEAIRKGEQAMNDDIHDLRFSLAVELFSIWQEDTIWQRKVSDLGIEITQQTGLDKLSDLILTMLDVPPNSDNFARDWLYEVMYDCLEWWPQKAVCALRDAAQEE